MNVTESSDNNQTASIYNGTSSYYTPVIPAIMFGTGVFGNCLALFVLARSSAEQKRTVFYRLVAGLALTDLFGIVATSPVTLAVYANNLKWIGGQPLCDYFSFIMIFAGFDTVFIVGAMAMDRYLALTHPYLYSANISHTKVKYIIIVLIIIAFILACLPLLGVGQNVVQYPGTWCFFDFKGTSVSNQIYSYIYASIGVLMILLLTITNIVVIGILIRMRRTTDAAEKKCMEKEIQMMIFLAGVVMIFTACWAPLMIIVVINQSTVVPSEADLMAIRLASLNQILDPWVYILFRKELIIKLKSILKTLFQSMSVSGVEFLDENRHVDEHCDIKLQSVVIHVNGQNISEIQRDEGDEVEEEEEKQKTDVGKIITAHSV